MGHVIALAKSDPRTIPRSNVFLTAALEAMGRHQVVRVRNISVRGALIDGVTVSLNDSDVRLRRGDLAASGQVAWQVNDQCGIRFDVEIDPTAWIKRIGHPGQRRVDQIIAGLRDEAFADECHDGPTGAVDEIASELSILSDRLLDAARGSPTEVELSQLKELASRLHDAIRLATRRG